MVKNFTTNKIIEAVNKIVKQNPKDAKAFEDYKSSVNPLLGTVNCWTEVAVRIDGEKQSLCKGDYDIADSINYILYEIYGIYKPYDEDDLRKIKGTYQSLIDANIIYPIFGLTSPEYDLNQIANKIIDKNIKDVKITYICDYNHKIDVGRCNPNIYRIKGTIEYDNKIYELPCNFETTTHILLHNFFDKICNNTNVSVYFDMKKEELERLINLSNFGSMKNSFR